LGITKYFVLPSRSTHILSIFVAFLTRFAGYLRVWSEDFRSGNFPFQTLKTSCIFCYVYLFIFFYIWVDLCSEVDQKQIYILLVLHLKFLVYTNRNFLQIFSDFYSFSSKFYLLASFLQIRDRNVEEQPIWGHIKLRNSLPKLGNQIPFSLFYSNHCKQAQGSPKGLTLLSCNNFLQFSFIVCLHLGECLAKPTPKIVRLGSSFKFLQFILYLFVPLVIRTRLRG
jgi:hypothetical protein